MIIYEWFKLKIGIFCLVSFVFFLYMVVYVLINLVWYDYDDW